MYRTEYPEPQFQREHWMNLNGAWQFTFDDQDLGIKEGWYQQHDFDKKIEVPFVYQTELSGIDDQSEHGIVWYQRHFTVKEAEDFATILHFGAVDFETDVWLDAQHIGTHVGGHTSFSFDITDYISAGEDHVLTVRAKDLLLCQ